MANDAHLFMLLLHTDRCGSKISYNQYNNLYDMQHNLSSIYQQTN